VRNKPARAVSQRKTLNPKKKHISDLGEAVYPSWWPILTNNMQTEPSVLKWDDKHSDSYMRRRPLLII